MPPPGPRHGPSHGGPVAVLAGAIATLLCGALAVLATHTPLPAGAAGSFPPRRTPVVWDNAALAPVDATPRGEPGAIPTRVVLPSLDLDAEVGLTGIGEQGELVVPDDFERAFWFEEGAVPGDPGVSVIVGHIDSDRGPAVFHPLERLKPGQEILVPRSDGVTARYTVTELKVFPKGRFPTDEVFGTAGAPGLRLITCIGRFDRKRKTYLDNLVVFAAPASPTPPQT